MCMPADEQDAHRRADGRARDVGADHHRASREAVAEHAPEREHRDLCERPRREREAHLGRAAAEVEDGERDRDRREVRPDVRDRTPGKEEAEVPA